MSGGVFGADYARAYDSVYRDKDYGGECAFLVDAFEQLTPIRVSRVVDLGCGTGGHALVLAQRGYQVTAVDRSEAMLSEARRKARRLRLPVTWVRADIRALNLDEKFDAAIMMFGVLSYQVEERDVLATLRSARRCLLPDGLLAFDVWYGPGVLAEGPSDRRSTFTLDGTPMERLACGTLESGSPTCRVEIVVRTLAGDIERREEHRMRYFFRDGLESQAAQAGFRLLYLTGFPDPELAAGQESWSALGVATAV